MTPNWNSSAYRDVEKNVTKPSGSESMTRDLGPTFLEPLVRHRNRRLQFLGEQRDREFLDPPAKAFQADRVFAFARLARHPFLPAPPPVVELRGMAGFPLGIVRVLLQAANRAPEIARYMSKMLPRRRRQEAGKHQPVALSFDRTRQSLRSLRCSRQRLVQLRVLARDLGHEPLRRVANRGQPRARPLFLRFELRRVARQRIVTDESAIADRVDPVSEKPVRRHAGAQLQRSRIESGPALLELLDFLAQREPQQSQHAPR